MSNVTKINGPLTPQKQTLAWQRQHPMEQRDCHTANDTFYMWKLTLKPTAGRLQAVLHNFMLCLVMIWTWELQPVRVVSRVMLQSKLPGAGKKNDNMFRKICPKSCLCPQVYGKTTKANSKTVWWTNLPQWVSTNVFNQKCMSTEAILCMKCHKRNKYGSPTRTGETVTISRKFLGSRQWRFLV